MKKVINTLIISGGGSRGVAYIGLFKKFEEIVKQRNILTEEEKKTTQLPLIDIKTVCAVSVGTIFSLIYLLGFTYAEMKEEILLKDLSKLKDIRFTNFLTGYGLDSGNLIINWIESLMMKKNIDKDITLLDLNKLNNIDFQIMATNLNKYCFTKFNYINTPELKVTDAIRMSMGIPFIYTYKNYKEHIHLDGGLISNFPIYLFEDQLDTTLGFKLINNGELEEHVVDYKIDDIENFIYHVLSCYIIQKEKRTTQAEQYKPHVIFIHTENITQTVNFSLSINDKKKLIKLGYDTASKYFDTINEC
jgi:NTE family protein